MSVRRGLVLVLALGLIGSGTELLLLDHYEDAPQMIPLGLIAGALVLLVWHLFKPSPMNTVVFRGVMVLFLLAGIVGSVLHMQAAAEFQREMDPAIDRWTLLTKVVRAKAPPALAPGVMIQLGLIGLTFTFLKEPRP